MEAYTIMKEHTTGAHYWEDLSKKETKTAPK